MANSTIDSEGFVTVAKKKSVKTRRFLNNCPLTTHETESVELDTCLKNILKAKRDVESSSFFNSFITFLAGITKELDKSIAEIVCFGLGHISSCKAAQHQLGLLLLLEEQFHCPVEVFDPVFCSVEENVIKELKLKLSPTNCEGKRKPVLSGGCTLFFFPHCPKELSNNLLYTNWNPRHIEHCILYSNSFEKIRLDIPFRFLKSYHYLLQSQEIVEEVPVPNIFHFPDIFNDLSLHYFPSHLRSNVQSPFWESPEPNYPASETEIVGNG
ncbi:hypothetical protein GHT06_016652 [Daphnia sinensis]|uniref:SRR1-like domain-containing protein n=1 Tax=Daphnia sinensis TaxID=1820382 RepID=A0AAD5PVC0_9CRUS|nr:hypothetical protein GHT06_016652 [Daphnia sinensis]